MPHADAATHRRLRLGRAYAALLLGGALGGCAETPIISFTDYAQSYGPGEQRAGGPDMPVIVRGNPFPIDAARFHLDVASAMEGATSAPQTHFVADAGNPQAAYRVVMAFDGIDATGAVLCARPAPAVAVRPAGGEAARIPLDAALCRGDTAISFASGSIGAAGGPRAPPFRRGVAAFAAKLFPAWNPANAPDTMGE